MNPEQVGYYSKIPGKEGRIGVDDWLSEAQIAAATGYSLEREMDRSRNTGPTRMGEKLQRISPFLPLLMHAEKRSSVTRTCFIFGIPIL